MKKTSPVMNAEMVQNAMLLRTELLRHLIDPKRDIDKECGYPVNPTIQDYKLLYEREGIATRVVDIFPEESWKHDPEVVENPQGDFTPWEKTWNKLVDKFNIWYELLRADCLSGVGSYGIILIGINDGKTLNLPVDGVDLASGKAKVKKEPTPAVGAPAKPTDNAVEPPAATETPKAKREITYLRSFDESVLSISSFETDQKNPRFGQPTMYRINLSNDGNAQASTGTATSQTPETTALEVHWTRCIHVADNKKNSTVFGIPRMKDVFNRLYDLRKVLGGSGEMFWKGGFPGIAFESAQGTNPVPLTDPEKKGLRAEFDNYQNGLQRYMALVGMTAKSLAPQVADPTPSFEAAIKAICTSKGIPYRIFMGTEEAQLAGSQDQNNWTDRLKRRQQKYIAPSLVRPFVDRLMAMGVVEFKEEYQVTWPELNTPSEKDKAEVAARKTDALSKYVSGNVEALIPPLEFLTYIMGMDTETATAILENALIGDDGMLEQRTEGDPNDPNDPMNQDSNAVDDDEMMDEEEDGAVPSAKKKPIPGKRPPMPPARNAKRKPKIKKVNGGAY